MLEIQYKHKTWISKVYDPIIDVMKIAHKYNRSFCETNISFRS